MKIAIVIFDKFTDLDLFLPWDVLNRVRSVSRHENWEVKILGTEESHLSDAGLSTPTMGFIDEAKEADAVLFTSGVNVPHLIRDKEYMERFQLNPERQLICSMCSGALFLGAMGLLDGKQATTYPTRRKLLASYGAEVVHRDFVNLGRIATAAGCLAGQDLSAWIISSLLDRQTADLVLRTIQPVGKGLD